MATTARNTTVRDRHRKTIAKHQPPCGICGDPIDYTLPHTDPMSYVVDHIMPIHKGGGEHNLTNKQAAHRACNRAKSNTIPEGMETPPRVFMTTLTW